MCHVLAFLDLLRYEVLFGCLKGLLLSVWLDVLFDHVVDEMRGYFSECLAGKSNVAFLVTKLVKTYEVNNVTLAFLPGLRLE